MKHKEVEEYILSLPNAKLVYPFGKEVAVYEVNGSNKGSGPDTSTGLVQAKMFALIQEGSDPVRLSLKCDPQLAVLLREKYETVLPGYHLNKKHWNTLILTGQLEWQEVKDLINLSYQLVTQ